MERLPTLPRAALIDLWRTHVQHSVPSRISRPLLVKAIAWALQARESGGHKATTLRRLRDLASNRSPALAPGSRLIREWQGQVHEVTVLERGFAYRNESYSSLSAIARAITGARWSGPRFFGIKAQ